MNCDEMAGDRLTVCEQELLLAFARLVSISSNFLYHCLSADIFIICEPIMHESDSRLSFFYLYSRNLL